MKLYWTASSPFVRKVLVAAHEVGVADRIQPEFLRPTPTKADPLLSKENPLNKIPTLLLDDGTPLYDSRVICEYIDSLHDGPKLVSAAGNARWRTLRLQATCDGILDSAIQTFYERAMRPKELHWADWIDGQSQKARQGLDALERECESFGAEVDLGQICAGITIGWLEFRNALGDVRAEHPKLTRWYEAFRMRPSMQATEPHA